MQALLKFSRAVDWVNTQVGKYVIWLILGSTAISAINAVVRKVFNFSSNAYLEVQWYLFAATFLLCSAYTPVSYTHLRAHETDSYLVCRLLLEKKKKRYKYAIK